MALQCSTGRSKMNRTTGKMMEPTIEDLMELNPDAPTKTWQQVLAENPHHAGGLAQLASAEKDAQSRSTAAQTTLSTSSTLKNPA